MESITTSQAGVTAFNDISTILTKIEQTDVTTLDLSQVTGLETFDISESTVEGNVSLNDCENLESLDGLEDCKEWL